MITDDDMIDQIVWNCVRRMLVLVIHNWWLTLRPLFVASFRYHQLADDFSKSSALLLEIQSNNVALFAKSESIVRVTLYFSRDCVKIRSTTNFPLVPLYTKYPCRGNRWKCTRPATWKFHYPTNSTWTHSSNQPVGFTAHIGVALYVTCVGHMHVAIFLHYT